MADAGTDKKSRAILLKRLNFPTETVKYITHHHCIEETTPGSHSEGLLLMRNEEEEVVLHQYARNSTTLRLRLKK